MPGTEEYDRAEKRDHHLALKELHAAAGVAVP